MDSTLIPYLDSLGFRNISSRRHSVSDARNVSLGIIGSKMEGPSNDFLVLTKTRESKYRMFFGEMESYIA